MIESRLLEVMSTLTNKELKNCHSYLVLNYPKRVETKLFDYVDKNLHKKNKQKLSSEYLSIQFKKDKTQVKKLLSDTLKKVEEFLVYQHFLSADYELLRLELLAEFYQSKSLKDRRKTVTDKWKKTIDKRKRKSRFDYWKLARWHQMDYYTSIPENYKESNIIALKKAEVHTRIAHTITSLIYQCELASKNNIAPLVYESEKLEKENEQYDEAEIINQIAEKEITLANKLPIKDELLRIKVIQLYVYFLEALTNPNKDDLQVAASYLFDNATYIHKSDAKRCFTYLVNMYSILLRKDQLPVSDSLEIYKKGINSSIILDDNKISSIRFMNIISVATTNSAFEWGYKFIEEYSDFVRKKEIEETIALAKANLLFGEKKFKDALNLLVKRCSILGNDYRQRIIAICCYVELGDYDETKNRLEALRKKMSSENVHSEIVTAIKSFRKCIKILLEKDRPKSDLHQLVESSQPIYMRTWLREKTNSYKQIFG